MQGCKESRVGVFRVWGSGTSGFRALVRPNPTAIGVGGWGLEFSVKG